MTAAVASRPGEGIGAITISSIEPESARLLRDFCEAFGDRAVHVLDLLRRSRSTRSHFVAQEIASGSGRMRALLAFEATDGAPVLALARSAADLAPVVAAARPLLGRLNGPRRALTGPAAVLADIASNDCEFETVRTEPSMTLELDAMTTEHRLRSDGVMAVEPSIEQRDAVIACDRAYLLETRPDGDSLGSKAYGERANRFLEPGGSMLLHVARNPVAFAGISARSGITVALDEVWVHPNWRGRGLAEHLVGECLRSARRSGARRAILRTGRSGLRQLYRSFGARDASCWTSAWPRRSPAEPYTECGSNGAGGQS